MAAKKTTASAVERQLDIRATDLGEGDSVCIRIPKSDKDVFIGVSIPYMSGDYSTLQVIFPNDCEVFEVDDALKTLLERANGINATA